VKNKKGFTLVELLAVIVILAIILVIAVPKILTVIDDTRTESMKSSALMIIDSAEREYATRLALGQSTTGIACTDVASVSATDFILPTDATKECQITYNTTTGAATLRLYGKAGGKFAGKCITAGTRGSITVSTTC
jgi:prepilin-type N-terminal cleavage/methylation domain-containing protein